MPDFPYFCDLKELKDYKYSNGFRPIFKEFGLGVRNFSDLKSGFMYFGLGFKDFRSDLKDRPYSKDFKSDIKYFRSDIKVFKPNFRDFCLNFTEGLLGLQGLQGLHAGSQ